MTGLVFNEELHRLGETVLVSRHSVRQGLAWLIAADIVRRHPNVCRIVETHPHMYDQVTVFARDDAADWNPPGWRLVVHLNKEHGGHVTPAHWFAPGDQERLTWLEVLLAENQRSEIVEPLERAEGLPRVDVSPSTESWSLGPRLLAAFAQRSMFAPRSFYLLNGMQDGEYGSEPRTWLFDRLPSAAAAVGAQPEDTFGRPEWRYWFVVEATGTTLDAADLWQAPAKPIDVVVAVDTIIGRAFTPTAHVDLMSRYQALKRNLDALVSEVCPPVY